MDAEARHPSASEGPGRRRATVSAVLAIAWGGAALAQGVVLEAPMQAIKKRAVPCAACTEPADLAGAENLLRGQDRDGPEFPAAQRDFAAGEGMPASASLVDVPSVVGIGSSDPVAAPPAPATVPAR